MLKYFIILILPFFLGLLPPKTLLAQTGSSSDPDLDWTFGGHLKYQFIYLNYPDNSVFHEFFGSSALNNNLEARLKFSATRDRWDFKADYQFIAIHADTLQLSGQLPGAPTPVNNVINDDRRWWNLTYSYGDDNKVAMIHRLDRLSVGLTTDKTAWRFGRQAISWGNGMMFTPMDVFNPFDPATVDKEYKTGDDMLYGQYLFNNGNDLQGVAIVRRDPNTGDVEKDQSSLAFKYHGFLGMNEFDLLAAEHFGDRILGLGGIVGIGGAVLRGDLTWTDTDHDSILSLAASISYSWNWGGKNISGLLEYYHNGFGQKNGAYSFAELAQNPDLLKRLERGELFTLAQNYLAASATIEMTPLFMLIPNFFINLEDPSALAQFVAQYDWKQDLQVLAALNIPVGRDGSEYGGIEAPVDGLYFSTGPSIFVQLAWYF
jgi:hypothetical protein